MSAQNPITATSLPARPWSALVHRLLITVAFWLLACGQATASHTSINDLIGTTEAFLEQHVADYLHTSQQAGRQQIKISRLDARLRLHRCSEPLQASLEGNKPPVGRLTVRVRCNGDTPWSIFVPAHVSLFLDVVVARHPVKRNSLLQPGDLMLAERDVGSLGQGYFLDPRQAVGSLATRALNSGQPVLASQLRQPPMVKRGDQVVISARSGAISVRMPGEALSDGSQGQQIRVRNLRSQRVVQARVVAPGQVEVPM